MLVTRSTALIFAALLLTTISTAGGFIVSPGGYLSPIASPPLLGTTSGINGSISIGPVVPVCSVIQRTAAAPPYYNQIQLVVTPSSGLSLTIPVNWVLEWGCWVDGSFRVGLNPGAYSLTLTSCTQVHALIYQPYQPYGYGCWGLPNTVIVESGSWTHVDISIDTGIR